MYHVKILQDFSLSLYVKLSQVALGIVVVDLLEEEPLSVGISQLTRHQQKLQTWVVGVLIDIIPMEIDPTYVGILHRFHTMMQEELLRDWITRILFT